MFLPLCRKSMGSWLNLLAQHCCFRGLSEIQTPCKAQHLSSRLAHPRTPSSQRSSAAIPTLGGPVLATGAPTPRHRGPWAPSPQSLVFRMRRCSLPESTNDVQPKSRLLWSKLFATLELMHPFRACLKKQQHLAEGHEELRSEWIVDWAKAGDSLLNAIRL